MRNGVKKWSKINFDKVISDRFFILCIKYVFLHFFKSGKSEI